MTKDMTMDPQAEARTGDPVEGARDAVRLAAVQVGEAVDTVRMTIPEVVRASRDFAGVALERIEAGSDQQISAGATMSLGLAIGMLLGGAPRLLIALALLPVAAIGLVLLDRRAPRPSGGSRATS